MAHCYLVALITDHEPSLPLPTHVTRQIVSVERLCTALSTYLPTLPDTDDPAAATAAVTVFKQAVLGFESRRKKDSAAVDPNAMLIDVRNAANLFRYAVLYLLPRSCFRCPCLLLLSRRLTSVSLLIPWVRCCC